MHGIAMEKKFDRRNKTECVTPLRTKDFEQNKELVVIPSGVSRLSGRENLYTTIQRAL